MNESEKKEFCAIMYPFGKVYDLSLDDKFIMKFWFEALNDLSLQELAIAVQRYVKSPDVGSFKPKPGDIIKMITGTSADRAYSAWTKTIDAVSRVGTYSTVVFDDPIIHRVIDDMGGWIELGLIQERELPFKQKEFCERYKGYSFRQEIPAHSTKMIGIIDAQNGNNGYKEKEKPVLIGDQSKSQLLLDGYFQPESSMNKKIEIGTM